MANDEHLERLNEGVDAWNAWRKTYPEVRPDLSYAGLRGAKLNGAFLSHAFLSHAFLSRADLSEADLSRAFLSGAILRGADLRYTNLRGADLSRADLREANLGYADLSEADLSRAFLSGADLSGANLNGANARLATLIGAILGYATLGNADLSRALVYRADLNHAVLGWTTLNGLDLSEVNGLGTVIHRGPSYISIDTLYKSRGKIPETFLSGAGVPDEFLLYMRSLTSHAIEYSSAFISYSSRDGEFARRLYTDLQAKNVRCWFAPEDLKIGDEFWERIDESIRRYDKVLVILSKDSVASNWVEDEVSRALNREREQPGQQVLFPIRVDDAVFSTTAAWASNIKLRRHMGDFTHWKDHDAYQRAFTRLLRDLKAGSTPQEGKDQ